ncbi:MAG: glycosyltransferase [Burkholderiales bacterium]|nr:glycosyltransferase [Burkholderiales bacterium]MDE1925908.1 glycosyltransferase [Burkholderiales bacterium]MDE2157425.1 glycosyltransferase [Burkholderiales bacterium]
MTSPRQRLLFITSRFPYPPIGGDRLRVFHLARLLARDFDVELLGLGSSDEDEIRSFCRETGVAQARAIAHSRWLSLRGAARALVRGLPLQVGYFDNAKLDAEVAGSLGRSDVIVCHLIRCSQVWRGQRRIPAVLDLCDAISSNYHQVVRTASLFKPWTWISRIEGPRVSRFEQREIGRFDLLTLVSAADARKLGAPPERTLLVTQGVDLDLFDFVGPDRRSGSALALVGKMDTYPNRSGALWFARHVLPSLPAGTRLKLIGDCPPALRREFEREPGVEVTGRVPDIAAACADCYAAVAPLNVATGIQNKVLEYFAMGLPAVLSPSVAGGLLAESAGTYELADKAEEWVAALNRLATDRHGALPMTERARHYVEQHHDWNRIGAALAQRLRQTLASDRAGGQAN